MLTDLITKEHLGFLGDVEWEGRGRFHKPGWPIKRRLIFHKKKGVVEETWEQNVLNQWSWWASEIGLSKKVMSCILEHAIRVKLGTIPECEFMAMPQRAPGGRYFIAGRDFGGEDWRYDTYEEALIAAIDALIKQEMEET